MPILTFDIGDVPRLRFKVRDYDGALVDPATITLIIDPPVGASVQVNGATPGYSPIVRVSLGEFYYPADLLTVEGTYELRIETTGPKGAEQSKFYVRKKNVVPS